MPRVRCPSCGRVFEATDSDDWTSTCPACDRRFYLRADAPEPAAPLPAPAPEVPSPDQEPELEEPGEDARSTVAYTPAGAKKGWRGCGCALLALAVLALGGALAWHAARGVRDAAEEQRCARSLERFGRRARAYALSHGGRLPDAGADEAPPPRGVTVRPGLTSNGPPDLVYAYSRPARMGACAVLFADGRVQVMPEAELSLLLEAQEKSPGAWARP